MTAPSFHHFQVTVADIERSREFYGGFLGLPEIPRPVFPYPGAWFELANGQQLHIVKVPNPLWRGPRALEIYETHIALRVDSFQKALAALRERGFREDAADDDGMRMVIKAQSPTGYPQVYFSDPDGHLLELNAAKLD